jgi:hypothetical protein
MNIKHLFVLLILIGSSAFEVKAQVDLPKIVLSYDEYGNRTNRRLVVFNQRQGKPEAKKDSLGKSLITIFPNPAKNFIQIKMENVESMPTSVLLYDFFGRLLYTKEDMGTSTKVDLSPYAAGTYMLKIRRGDKETLWKVLKEE